MNSNEVKKFKKLMQLFIRVSASLENFNESNPFFF